ncbi:uncharacterized protein LOC117287860 [Asterias rubens]|uniref:uncharacterized protein LOC117287860 n=1 Tax=Asterias rubens TaxID=7604 RepID=UPI0014550869|nr:uncharacterized protein LOC117287860 [Asterias rubens]
MTSPNSQSTEAAQYFNNIVSRFLASIPTIDANVLASCFQNISQTYRKGLHRLGIKLDWRDNCYRGVYVHRFFALHSYLVYQSLHSALADKTYLTEAWNNEPCFRVCCIGGGPGSDALGLTKFLRDNRLVPTNRLECTIFDRYREWEDTWKKMTKSNANIEFPPMTYISRDMTGCTADLSILDKIRSADFVSFVKFFSTVSAAIGADATRGNLLREVFRELKPGALVFYTDNIFGDRHGEFKRIAYSGGVTDVLFEKIHFPISLPVTERSVSSKSFDAAIQVAPLLSCSVTVMLLRKPHMDNGQNISSEAEPIHTEAENALEAELIHTEADNAAEPIHIEADNALEAEPIHTEADEALLEAEPIHTEADNALEAEPIHTEADEALIEAEPIHTEGDNALEAEPIHTEADNALEAEPIHTDAGEALLEAEPIHTEADNALEAEPIHTEADNALEAEPIHTDAGEALLEAEHIHTEADPEAEHIHTEADPEAEHIHTEADEALLEAEPIHTEADDALEAEPIHTEADEALPEVESILSMTTAPIVAPGDIKSDVQPQDTDQVSVSLKLGSKVNPSRRFTPY